MQQLTNLCLSCTVAGILLWGSQDLASVDATTKTANASQKSMRPMPLVAPLFIDDPTTSSTITIVSDSPEEVNADLSLSNLSGEELAKTHLTLPRYSRRILKVADLLDTSHHPRSLSTFGSVTLMPKQRTSLAAQLSITRNDRSNDVEEEFVMLGDSGLANYRAVANVPSRMPLLSLMSLSSTPQDVTVNCLFNGRTATSRISLAPKQTTLIRACREQTTKQSDGSNRKSYISPNKSAGIGIGVSSTALAGELAVFGVGELEGGEGRMLTAVPFWDVNALKSSSAIYTGVSSDYPAAFGSPMSTLVVTVANFSNYEKRATVLLASGNGPDSTQKVISTLLVPSNGVSTADLSKISPDANTANSIIVQMEGVPGEMLSDVHILAKSSLESGLIPLAAKDLKQVDNGGEHPWETASSISSTLLLFNPDLSQKEGSIQLSIHTGVAIWSKKLSIPALATVPVSVNDIISKQQRDDKGRTLPLNSSDGIVTWVNLTSPRIFGKLVQRDEANGLVRTFACGDITYAMSYMWEPGGFYGLPGDSQFLDTVMEWSDGTISYNDDQDVSTGDEGIATIQFDVSTGSIHYRVTGVSGGDTGIFANSMTVAVDSGGNEGQLTATSGALVVVPTYFEAVQAVTAAGECPSGQTGSFFNVKYQVLDQNGSPIARAGMTPLESVAGTGIQSQPFATPPTTASDGTLLDTPVGSCFTTSPPTQNFCVSVVQSFQIIGPNNQTFNVLTTTGRRDCEYGQSLTTTGNPPGEDHTYSQGAVN